MLIILRRTYCSQPAQIIRKQLKGRHADIFNPLITPFREAWIHNFDSLHSVKLGLIQLHPQIFASFPRTDLINENIKWQRKYRQIDWLSMPTSAEFKTGNKKPWPQKGTGRARHSSTRSPQWHYGGWCHGPRGPTTQFYLLPFYIRVWGLISTLSAKFAQNDIKIVDSLENFPSDNPKFLEEFMANRAWGPSVLIVNKSDIFPRNISLAAEGVNHINLMPVYGLNVYSMLKHETLILTPQAVEEIEDKLLHQLSRTDLKNVIFKHKPPEIVPNYPNLDPEVQP